MNIPDKPKLQKISFNHLSDRDFKNFVNLYKRWMAKQHYVLVNDTTLASDNLLRFRCYLFLKMLKLNKQIDGKIGDEKLQYDINREAWKISALWSNNW